MTSPTDPQPSTAPAEPATSPPTQEIPVPAPAAPAPQLPPHPAATSPAPVQTVQATGPVDFVPGPPVSPAAGPTPAGATAVEPPVAPPSPGTGPSAAWPDSLVTGPVPLPEQAAEPGRQGPDRSALVALGLVLASLVLLQLGLALRFGTRSFWSDIPLWSAFATVCAVLGLAASASLFPGRRRIGARTAWRIAAGGLVGLAAFWVLVVLPVVASDRGFLITAALACLGGALWIGPARKG